MCSPVTEGRPGGLLFKRYRTGLQHGASAAELSYALAIRWSGGWILRLGDADTKSTAGRDLSGATCRKVGVNTSVSNVLGLLCGCDVLGPQRIAFQRIRGAFTFRVASSVLVPRAAGDSVSSVLLLRLPYVSRCSGFYVFPILFMFLRFP